jgi:glycosyltransferase involved in cell wall biosynthesis
MYQHEAGFYRFLASFARHSAPRVVPRLTSALPLRSVDDFGCGQGARLSVWRDNGPTSLGAGQKSLSEIRSVRVARSPRASARADPGPRFAAPPHVSVIVPVYNEAESLPVLLETIVEVMRRLGASFEIIAVNDGSSDDSLAVLRRQAEAAAELRIIDFRRNYGQTAAMMAGIDHSAGRVIVPIDADLQNDPEDIPALLDKLDEGYDVVSGWRTERKDARLRRTLISAAANRVISYISGVRLHDYGCTLKAYRADVMQGVRLYGEMHRFIPIYASWMGARVTEIPVHHTARRFGRSKYGLERIVKVILDLIVVRFLDRYFVKPIYIFGGFGIFSLFASFLSFVLMIYLRLVEGISMILTPLPLLTVMAFLIGNISILMGLIAEMLVRTYFESQGRSAYAVRELINFDSPNAV